LIFKKRYLVRTCNPVFLTLDMDLGFFEADSLLFDSKRCFGV
jgi:hypothetical protein